MTCKFAIAPCSSHESTMHQGRASPPLHAPRRCRACGSGGRTQSRSWGSLYGQAHTHTSGDGLVEGAGGQTQTCTLLIQFQVRERGSSCRHIQCRCGQLRIAPVVTSSSLVGGCRTGAAGCQPCRLPVVYTSRHVGQLREAERGQGERSRVDWWACRCLTYNCAMYRIPAVRVTTRSVVNSLPGACCAGC